MEDLRAHSVAVNAICYVGCTVLLAAGSKIDDARELERQGKLEAASNLLSTATREFRDAGDAGNLARALGIAADISLALGRYEAAIGQASESLRVRAALHQSASVGDDYNVIGLAQQYLGSYPAALDAYQHALTADRGSGDTEGLVTRLNNIGNVYYFQGRYSEALHSYADAMRTLSGNAGATWKAAKHELTVANLAVLFQRLGQDQRALGYYREIVDPRRADSAKDMPAGERAQLLLNQGVLYRRLGDPVKALELYTAAQSLFQADRHRDGEIGTLRNIGIVRAMDLNDLPGAMDSFTRALELAEHSSNRRGVAQARLYRGELLHRQGRLKDAEGDVEASLRAAKEGGLVEEQWKGLHALGRIAEGNGRMEDAARDYQLAIATIEALRASLKLAALRSDFLADKRDVYDSLIQLRLRDPNCQPAEIFNWMERSRARTLLDRVRGRVWLPDPTMEAIQPRLAAGTLLVEFWMGSDSGAAVWVTNTSAGLVRYRDATGDGVLNGIPAARRMIVVPDGALSSVPFEMLRVPGSDSLLIEKCEVSYLPSARFVARKPRARWMTPWSEQVVALADPTVTNDPFGEHWAPLPEAAGEVRALAAILPGRAQIHLGADMQKRYLAASALDGSPVLHLATHALVDAENPDRSRILFVNDYLLQEEVYDLNLMGVDLVTLSACDTARGKLVRGESVQAFSQAFLAAGATAVVTTMWRVADGPTADFMKQFYYGLARGESKSAALRDAKLRFLHSHSALANPRYWAAFILTGDGSSPIPRAIPWNICLLAAALLLAAAGVMAARRPRRKA